MNKQFNIPQMIEYKYTFVEPGVHRIHVVNMFLPPLNVLKNGMDAGPFIILNDDQFRRYSEWQANRKNYLIQDILPDLSVDEREFLISGITPKQEIYEEV